MWFAVIQLLAELCEQWGHVKLANFSLQGFQFLQVDGKECEGLFVSPAKR